MECTMYESCYEYWDTCWLLWSSHDDIVMGVVVVVVVGGCPAARSIDGVRTGNLCFIVVDEDVEDDEDGTLRDCFVV